MSITSNIAKKLRTVTGLLTLGTVADGEYLRRSGSTIVGGPGGAAGIGGSTGATDNAILRADGTGGATLQNSGVTIDDSSNVKTAGALMLGTTTASAKLSITMDANEDSTNYGRGIQITNTNGVTKQAMAFVLHANNVESIGWNGSLLGFGSGQATDSNFLPTHLAVSAGTGHVTIGSTTTTSMFNVGSAAQFQVNSSGQVIAPTVRVGPYTVATLPTPTTGMYTHVTDGDAGLAWGATVVNTGAGATKYLVWYNGTNWTVAGK